MSKPFVDPSLARGLAHHQVRQARRAIDESFQQFGSGKPGMKVPRNRAAAYRFIVAHTRDLLGPGLISEHRIGVGTGRSTDCHAFLLFDTIADKYQSALALMYVTALVPILPLVVPVLVLSSHSMERILQRLGTTDVSSIRYEIYGFEEMYLALYASLRQLLEGEPGTTSNGLLLPTTNGAFVVTCPSEAVGLVATTWLSNELLRDDQRRSLAAMMAWKRGPISLPSGVRIDASRNPYKELLALAQVPRP